MYQIFLASFFDLPSALLMKMFMHVLIDCIIGILPFIGKQSHLFIFYIYIFLVVNLLSLGDILDVFYKANLYNLHILETWLKKRYGNGITIYKDDSGTNIHHH